MPSDGQSLSLEEIRLFASKLTDGSLFKLATLLVIAEEEGRLRNSRGRRLKSGPGLTERVAGIALSSGGA